MYSGHHASDRHLSEVAKILGRDSFHQATDEHDAVIHARNATVFLGHRYLRQVLPHAKKLRWVQASSSGYDHLPWKTLRDQNITLTRTTLASVVIAQHAVMLGLALSRRLQDIICLQSQRRWGIELIDSPPAPVRRALVLGFGSIGQQIARILHAAEIEVTAVKRAPLQAPDLRSITVVVEDSWRERVHEFDQIFLALPNAQDTLNIFDAKCVAALKQSAVVVNVGRAETMDLGAIVRRLTRGDLAGAALDTPPQRQPLSPESELWQVPNLIISPYVAARYTDRWDDIERFFEQQLRRWQSGVALENEVHW